MARSPEQAPHDGGSAARLTPTELEILRLLTTGMTMAQVARHLGRSPHTIRTHCTHAARKLGARSTFEAAMRAVQLGLIE